MSNKNIDYMSEFLLPVITPLNLNSRTFQNPCQDAKRGNSFGVFPLRAARAGRTQAQAPRE